MFFSSFKSLLKTSIPIENAAVTNRNVALFTVELTLFCWLGRTLRINEGLQELFKRNHGMNFRFISKKNDFLESLYIYIYICDRHYSTIGPRQIYIELIAQRLCAITGLHVLIWILTSRLGFDI